MSNLPFADRGNLKFRAKGISFECASEAYTVQDYELTENFFCNGAEVLFYTQETHSHVTFQVVDKNNVLGFGENLVLDTFVDNWNLSAKVDRNGPITLNYPALLRLGLFIRITVFNASLLNTTCFVNLFLHQYTGDVE